ncbi:hypothetical protein Q1695_009731 [Nippostrongylus brasiliensis]|nr:hypothetical protein Q1695_009731 [Nippostrongylus brasiliensis]
MAKSKKRSRQRSDPSTKHKAERPTAEDTKRSQCERNDATKRQNGKVCQNVDRGSDEVVPDSQESGGSSSPNGNDGKEGCSIFDEKLKKLFSLCEHLTDDKWKFPEKTKCPIRDEYRMLYCVSSLCEKVRILLATQITSALRLRDIRSQSLEQLKALCRRLEDSIARDSSAEKYFSFDDVAQRNALEVMGIRYEELCDDIFAMDEGFDSLLENNDVFMEGVEGVPSISMSSELANYAELCMQSMLTEVGLRYVDKAHKFVKSTAAKTDAYRKLRKLL